MTVTSPTLTPAPAIRASLSNTTDMVELSRESRSPPPLLDAAGRDHRRRGDRCRAAREHGGVGRHEWHDRQDRVLRAYPCRCRQGADAISDAYLKERTALVEQRANEMASAVNEQIATLEAELKSLNPVVDEDGDVVSTNPRAKELTEDINKLKEQAADAGALPRHRRPRHHEWRCFD